MTHEDMVRDRVAVLEMYMEQRRSLKESLYRMIKSAAEVRVGPDEFATLTDALKLVERDPWSIRREIQDLRGER